MRHLSFQSPVQNVFAYDPDDQVGSVSYFIGRNTLLEIMDARLDFLTPAEERVLDDFANWVVQLRGSDAMRHPSNGTFAYFDLNTGRNAIFVASFGYGDYAVSSKMFC